MRRISVCLGFHNGARFLKPQIDSILAQLGVNDELICSNDNSTDESLRIIESYNDSRIKILQAPFKNNHVRNFEHALAACTGKIIFLSDQDDIWEEEKILTVTHHLQFYDLVLTDCSIIDENGNKYEDSYFHSKKSRKGIVKNLVRNSYMGCCMAFHRKVLDKALPFPADLAAHDQWIGLIAEKHFRVYFLNKPLVRYRRHGQNSSFTGEKSSYGLLEKINYRLNMLYNLSTR